MRVYGRTTDLNGHGVPADVALSFDNHGMKRFSVKSDSEDGSSSRQTARSLLGDFGHGAGDGRSPGLRTADVTS